MASSRLLCLLTLGAASPAVAACSAFAESPSNGNDPAQSRPTSIGTETLAATSDDAVCTSSHGTAFYKYKNLFFGDLHSHTQNSLDAFIAGTRVTPAQAYLFAKQQLSITIASGANVPYFPIPWPGPTVTIDRPLDFLAVTDHSEWLGIDLGCRDPSNALYNTSQCNKLRSLDPYARLAAWDDRRATYDAICAGSTSCAAKTDTAWNETKDAARDANDACVFTSFVAYEWTSQGPKPDANTDGPTYHRNVIFANCAVPQEPLDSYAYQAPLDLWQGLEAQCTGDCRALTIPHNTNLSRGGSIGPQKRPQSDDEMRLMQKYQRLVEIYQHKGSSECSTQSGTDFYCGFEYFVPQPKDAPMSADEEKNSYVRTALEDGMAYAALGTLPHKNPNDPTSRNPFQLGIVGSTDDHDGTPGHVLESDYVGHSGQADHTVLSRLNYVAVYSQYEGSGGLTGVWAEQNTRKYIFDALQRRETFATSGPRIKMRFFGTTVAPACGGTFPQNVIDNNAVLMGGVMHAANLAGPPHFAIQVYPDPQQQMVSQPPYTGSATSTVAGLQQLQIIKAHVAFNTTGPVIEEHPYDVTIAPMGGCVEWTDPSFHSNEFAFYYVRVLQVPTNRWSQYDCAGVTTGNCAILNTPIRERAWTSPIWYEPSIPS